MGLPFVKRERYFGLPLIILYSIVIASALLHVTYEFIISFIVFYKSLTHTFK